MAEAGDVEIGVASQASRFDEDPGRGDFIEQLQRAFPRAGIVGLPQLDIPSDESYPEDEFYPGTGDEDLANALDDVCATWRSDVHGGNPPKGNDACHLESHVTEKRHVFLTNDGQKGVGCFARSSD